jgi:hypothetical protein
MAISAETISRAVYDKPVQPLFNTLYMSSLNAGIPVIVTNTNNNLRVTATAVIGSVASGTAITDAMFSGKTSGVTVDGFQMTDNDYFTLLDLESNISQLPNEFRSDAAGLDPAALVEVLMLIGNRMSEQLLANYFANLQANIVALAPAANVKTAQAGQVEWNPLAATPTGTLITTILDDIIASLPNTMKVGGAAGQIVTGWVSADDFLTLKNSAVEAFQPNKNGGLTSNLFSYVKEEFSVQESRDLINREFIRYKNIILLPLNGMAADSLIITYQEGIQKARVFYDKVPAAQLNNWYMVVKGAFITNQSFTVPVNEKSQQMFFNLPYQVGNLLTINKVENAIAQYKVISKLSSGVLFRESDKVFAYLPN